MIFAAWCACCAMSVAAQDCEISLTIAKAAQKEELPSQVQEILGNRLAAAVAAQYLDEEIPAQWRGDDLRCS